MVPTYDDAFVVLSIVVAVMSSYAALDLAGRVRTEAGEARRWWIVAGATVMGLGIWSMHFIGMLAFHLPVPIRYDIPLMLLSVMVAIGASFLALTIVTRPHLTARTVPAGVAMGFAIAGMHYIGMASVRTNARLSYVAPIVGLSVLIAVAASLVALWLAFRFRSDLTSRGLILKILSALLMGAAISGMHYTAMAAARFAPGHVMPESSTYHVPASGGLAATVIASSILIIVLALIGAVVDRSFQARAAFTRELAERTLSLSKSEQQYRRVVDTALDAVVSMDGEGLITDWNTQAENIFGWSRAEAVGRRLSQTIIPPEYCEAHERGLKRFLETGEGPVLNTRIEILAIRRDGITFPVELAISPARLEDGWTFNGFIRDLTDRNKAAEAVRLGMQRYRELFEDVPVGLYSSDAGGRLIDVNPAMVSMLGFANRDALLATPATALYVDSADRARWEAEMRRAGFVRDFEVKLRRADGTIIWARDTTHAKREPDGTIVLYEGVLEDITARVEAERRLRASEAELRQALKMEAVGQLAGGVAHDFNNLLTVILSYSAMLLDRIDQADPNRQDVQEISAAADRAAGLTRQLLAFSRQQVMQPRVLNMNAVVGELENMLRRLIGEDIELRTSFAQGGCWINADPGQIEQVLLNLVVNARDAMPKGGQLTITTSTREACEGPGPEIAETSNHHYVVLSVSDTGTGMSAEVQQRLFDPFFTTKEQGRGTGLGLSTVYGIVQQSGGEISVQSESGRGTTFTVCFPRVESGVEEQPSASPAVKVARGSETVLLVEDDNSLRALAFRVLVRYGYKVLAAADGTEALAIAADRGTAIDGVITDVVMPGMNGRELAERLAAQRPGLSFLFMSGYTDDDVLRRGVLHGESAFLAKPFTPAQLAHKVREILDARNERTG